MVKYFLAVMAMGLSCPLWSSDSLHYAELALDFQDKGIQVTFQPQTFAGVDTIKDKRHSLDDDLAEHFLDAAIRQTVFLLRTLERNRGSLVKAGTELEILEIEARLTLRDDSGEELQTLKTLARLGLAMESNRCFIRCNERESSFEISSLNQPETYRAFLSATLFPEEKAFFPLADQGKPVLVELSFVWPRLLVKEKEARIFDLFPSLLLWQDAQLKKLTIQLGSTYAIKVGEQWQQNRSSFHARQKEAIQLFASALAFEEAKQPLQAIEALESYLGLVPVDRKALERLAHLYQAQDMNQEALSLMERFQPFFTTIREGLANQKKLAAESGQVRRALLGTRRHFQPDPSLGLRISSPQSEDILAGTATLEFSLEPGHPPLLLAEALVNGSTIGTLTAPPYRLQFSTKGLPARCDLTVRAWFANERMQETSVAVSCMQVDEEEWVRLLAVRAVVSSGNSFLTDLTMQDFTLLEEEKPRKIEHFQRDTTPLRVAFLVDTSLSMSGEKIHRAQKAIASFLARMQPEDRAALYSYDHSVLRLMPFTHDFAAMSGLLYTLSPQSSTSLYDAMLAAVDDLQDQQGNPVLIVVSDGTDTGSASTDLQVVQALRASSVLVYSLVLPGDFMGESNAMGMAFLEEMARLTGSVSQRISRTAALEERMAAIYQELRSFYYLDFYSQSQQPDAKLRLKSSRGKARFRILAEP